MKLLLVTDIHSDFLPAQSAFITEKPDAVLDCGDHERFESLFEYTPYFYIHGNHEPRKVDLTQDTLPLSYRLSPYQIVSFKQGSESIHLAGIDGNYTSKMLPLSVQDNSIISLKEIAPGELDLLLLHESPLNALHFPLAQSLRSEIQRIQPRYVFSGHRGAYSHYKDNLGITYIELDEMKRGYGLLTVKDGEYLFERKLARFT
ncbi:MAG TPA: metallophosphoesterase [Candidatus Nanoarchaeia archaeon]|nr:metallophosphoesterase [Candidatus Nanoarchaeia archaeon]